MPEVGCPQKKPWWELWRAKLLWANQQGAQVGLVQASPCPQWTHTLPTVGLHRHVSWENVLDSPGLHPASALCGACGFTVGPLWCLHASPVLTVDGESAMLVLILQSSREKHIALCWHTHICSINHMPSFEKNSKTKRGRKNWCSTSHLMSFGFMIECHNVIYIIYKTHTLSIHV